MDWKKKLLAIAALACAFSTALAEPGDFDSSFTPGSGSSGSINAVALDDQERLVVAGGFREYNELAAGRILRLLPDGARDPEFDPGTGANNAIKAVEILPDGRILLGGNFTEFNGTPSRGIVMLRQDGSIDSTFTSLFSDEGFSVGVTCLESLANGNIVVGGYFTEYGGDPVGRYVILSSTGFIAEDSGSGADSHVFDIDALANGQILISGFFELVGGHATACVARLNSNGSVDTSFGTGSDLGSVAYSVVGQSDGKVIIGGSFSNYFGQGQRYLGRLTSTGAPDTSYQGNTSPDLNVYGLTLDREERLIVAGQFDSLHGSAAGGIGRLLPDGTLDASFTFHDSVSPSFFQEYPIDSAGRIIAYGWASFFPEDLDVEIVRLEGSNSTPREIWLGQYFGSDLEDEHMLWEATPAGDGISNLLKYALGFQGDPTQPTSLLGEGGLIFGLNKSDTASEFRFRTDFERSDAHAIPEWSRNLVDWSEEDLLIVEESREANLIIWKVTLPQLEQRVFFRMNAQLKE